MSTPNHAASWDALSAPEQSSLERRLTYLHAVVEHTYLLTTRAHVQFIVGRACALHELYLYRFFNIPAEVHAAARKAVHDVGEDWLGIVRSTLRDYRFDTQFEPRFELDPLQKLNHEALVGLTPPAVVSQMNAFCASLLKDLCTTAPYLIGFGRKRLLEFCKEQAKFSREPVFEDDYVGHVTERVQYVNRLLEGRFQKYLDNPEQKGALSIQSMYKRTCDPVYLFKALRKITTRAKECIFVRLGLVGHRGEKYSSSHTTQARLEQHERTAKWMRETGMIETGLNGLPLSCDEASASTPLTLADCAKSATHRFAKLYTFTNAIETISKEEGLSSGMLTITMPPMFHPNPMFGNRRNDRYDSNYSRERGDHNDDMERVEDCHGVWTGPMPDQTNRQLSEVWKKVLRRLAALKIGITGLRAVEPHQDGCPHWHVWLNYQPQHQNKIIEIVMTEFPGGLRLKTSSSTVVFESAHNFVNGVGVMNPQFKTSTRLDFAVIDRTISSGASYLMKYLLKSFDTSQFDRRELSQSALDLIDEVNKGEANHQETNGQEMGGGQAQASTQPLFATPHSPEVLQAYAMERSDLCDHTPPSGYLSEAHKNCQRIDAYRGAWTLRAFDFFGLARCLGVWDVLRQLSRKPSNPHLGMLWALARGSEQEGRIPAGSQIRGKAVEFIRALGCMRAVSFEPAGPYFKIGLLTSDKKNQYGDNIGQVVGLRLFEMKKTQVPSQYVNHSTGELKTRNRLKWVKTELTQLITKTRSWLLKQTTEARQASLNSTRINKKHDDFKIGAHELDIRDLSDAEIAWYIGDTGKAEFDHQSRAPHADQQCLHL